MKRKPGFLSVGIVYVLRKWNKVLWVLKSGNVIVEFQVLE